MVSVFSALEYLSAEMEEQHPQVVETHYPFETNPQMQQMGQLKSP